MATSPVEIMNSALRKLGAERITDPAENNTRARLVSASYDSMLRMLLVSHPWRFNKGYSALALIDPKPADIFDYDFVFALPNNCARVFEVDDPNVEWEVIGDKYLAANSSSIIVKFGKYITDVTQFDGFFEEVLACAIASDISFALTQSTAQRDSAEAKFERILREGRSFSAQAASQKRVGANLWLSARRR